jgi:hypothetical protein
MAESRAQAIRELLWKWGPLGDDDPTDPHLPRDKYDWLVRGGEREPDEGTDTAGLAGYLTDAVRERYSLDHPSPADTVAKRIMSL